MVEDPVAMTVMTQYYVSKGPKMFGKDGFTAVDKELRELVMRDVIAPLHPDKLKREEKKAVLQYIMILTKKRCGRIKGRGCADGRKQHFNTHQDNASFPMVLIAALMLSCVIDAKENCDVATFMFMQADMDKLVNMKIEGLMAKLLVKIKHE
eukprot:7077392-Ditylum_brightwellii.AAC.1